MAPRYRPVARLRLRVRRRVQNVVGIITGQHPGESTSVEQYYASTCTSSTTTRSSAASSSSFGTSSNPPRIFRRQQQQRRYSQLSRSKASYHSLTSINESDEDSLVDRASTRTPSSGMSSANVSVFDSDSDDYDDDDDEDDDGFEDTDSEISSISEGHDGRKPSNPFSDYYSSPATTTGVAAVEEGAELTRVHARGDKPTPLQRRRANDPYNTQVRLDGVSSRSSSGAASARTRVQRVALPKGMKWKSTPGAFYGFTSSGGTTAGRNNSRKTGKNGLGGSGPSTPPSASSPSRTATATAPRPTNAKIIEIPWNHTAHGAYQTLRPADRKSVRSWTSGAIAAGGIDAGTMMAMMECHTPACDMLLPLPSAASSYGYGSSRGGAASRLAEFDGLAGLAYGGGGLGEADMQWLEYMSIPSGSLGKASRWVGRRLGLCSSSTSSSSGAGSTSIGCSAGSRSNAGGVAHAGVGPLGGKPSLLKTATEGSKGGVVSQLAAPGAAAVRVVSAKRVRFA